MEGGTIKSVVADGQWHLYEWDFEDDGQWNSYYLGDGSISNPAVTIDSIVFMGIGASTIFLDAVAHNPDGSLLPTPGDFNGDNRVDGDDLAAWKTAFGPTNADGDADDDGDSDGADFLVWQRNVTSASVTPTALPVPEPTALVLGGIAIALSLFWSRRAWPMRST
jgi:hypothetical protein